MTNTGLPLGVNDLDPNIVVDPRNPNRVRCYVRGCQHFVQRPTRYDRGEQCPVHGIYCHYSGGRATYRYADVRRNIIASPELFATRVVGHPFKYESDRMGSENSEDAVTWNVFRSFSEMKQLATLASLYTGESNSSSPRLYLWGIRVDDDSFEPWDLLIAARKQFESNLPVKRPLTEPDIALYLPGEYLVLIEAKFTSPNPCYERGSRQNAQSLTLDELLSIYWHPSLQTLNHALACLRTRVHYQLWRNMIFAEWMARLDSLQVRPYHLNLVREGTENESLVEFSRLLHPELALRFRRVNWETLGTLQVLLNDDDENLKSFDYLQNKTACLGKAFRV